MARMIRATRKRLGEILVEGGLITEAQLIEALKAQRQSGELLGEALVRMAFASEDDIAGTLVSQFSIPYMPVTKYEISDEVKQLFPPLLLKQYQFVPIDRMGNVLAVVAGGHLTPEILRELEQFAHMRIFVYVGKQSDVRELIKGEFGGEAASKGAGIEEVPSWLQDE